MGDLISRKRLLKHISEWQKANAGGETMLEYSVIESCYRMVKNFPDAEPEGKRRPIDREQAIRILDPETALQTLSEIAYFAGFREEEAVENAVMEAREMAVEALRDVKPKGRWEDGICPNCGYYRGIMKISTLPNYCENCGTDMRSEEE